MVSQLFWQGYNQALPGSLVRVAYGRLFSHVS